MLCLIFQQPACGYRAWEGHCYGTCMFQVACFRKNGQLFEQQTSSQALSRYAEWSQVGFRWKTKELSFTHPMVLRVHCAKYKPRMRTIWEGQRRCLWSPSGTQVGTHAHTHAPSHTHRGCSTCFRDRLMVEPGVAGVGCHIQRHQVMSRVSFTGYFHGFPLSQRSWGAALHCHSASWPYRSHSGCCGSLLSGPEGESCVGQSERGYDNQHQHYRC